MVVVDGSLRMRFYGIEEEEFTLRPYQEDSFTWLPSHDELASKGRYYDYPLEYYVVEFGVGEDAAAYSLTWQFDFALEGEVHEREEREHRG
jgi:hypothetical protein